MSWTLREIRKHFKKVVGLHDLDDDSCDDYINKYYSITFPVEASLERTLTSYDFLTIPNQRVYPFDNINYFSVANPATINGVPIILSLNTKELMVTSVQTPLQAIVADGITSNFEQSVGNKIRPGTALSSDGVEVFQDMNVKWDYDIVEVKGSKGGSMYLDYNTGAISLVFATAPAKDSEISTSLTSFQPYKPQKVFYCNNQFYLEPTPDKVYKFSILTSINPEVLTSASSQPLLEQWGEVIVYGSAKICLMALGDFETHKEVSLEHEKQLLLCKRRTLILNGNRIAVRSF